MRYKDLLWLLACVLGTAVVLWVICGSGGFHA